MTDRRNQSTDYRVIEDLLEDKAIAGEHIHVKRYRDERHSVCICGEVWWTGRRWDYMERLDEVAEAARKGIER